MKTEMTLQLLDEQIEALQKQRAELIKQSKSTVGANAIKDIQYACKKPGNRNVIIIGGQGQLGRLFVQLFEQSHYSVSIIEKDDWPLSEKSVSHAALVLVAVPINLTIKVIETLPQLSSDCVLADVTSIKEHPLDAMLDAHSGPVVGLHPMFGPDVTNFNNQTVIVCDGRDASAYQWLIQQLTVWQAKTYQISAKQHDSAMAMVQVMRHFSTVVYGYHLMHEDTNLAEIIQLSSPIYRLELAMVGRLFAQAPELYTDIIFSNIDNVMVIKRFVNRFEELLVIMESGDKEAFVSIFNEVSKWFGDYAEQFLHESSEMLVNTNKALIK